MLALGLLWGVSTFGTSQYEAWLEEGGWLELEAENPRLTDPPVLPGDSAAYPGAVGWGAPAFAKCHDPTDAIIVERVTSLSNEGAGSLDYILENSQHGDTVTVIIFDLGGWGRLNFDGKMECTYIAGQTSPGGGIAYHRFTPLWIESDSENFVVAYTTWASDARDCPDGEAPGLCSTPNMVIEDAKTWAWWGNDHWWGVEKHLRIAPSGATDTILDGTLQSNLFAMTPAAQPTSIQMGTGDNGGFITRISWYQNLWHTCGWRCPNLIVGDNTNDVADQRLSRGVANAHFNNGRQANWQSMGWNLDVIDNYVKTGLGSNDGVPSGAYYSWTLSLFPATSGAPQKGRYYVERVIDSKNRDLATTSATMWTDEDSEQTVSCFYQTCETGGGGDPRDGGSIASPGSGSLIKTTSPTTSINAADLAMPRIDPFELPDLLFGTATDSGQVGNWRRIQCDGTWTPRADSVHAALLKEARDSTGVSITAITEAWVLARQLYTKTAGTSCTDTDSDGMPDAFEVRIQGGVDYTGAEVTGDPDADGYPHIMEYVNGSDPLVYTNADGTEGDPPEEGEAATYRAGADTVWVRQMDATDQPIYTGSIDSVPTPTDWNDVPDADGEVSSNIPTPTTTMFHFTCDSVVSGASVLDSLAFRAATVAAGLDPDWLMAISWVSCRF
jgi:hypothetical protein